ncbi:hypothetical protein CPB86DRAFT_596270 [Serendipita vermifera]|nr:hypothetical protein CPB86DRAFT_596270 [Serendipita vermifera]
MASTNEIAHAQLDAMPASSSSPSGPATVDASQQQHQLALNAVAQPTNSPQLQTPQAQELLQQPQQSSPTSSPPTTNATTATGTATTSRFIPYHSIHHNPTKGRYITSNDPRGYIPVYEYPLNGQWIMMDMDDGYILWTGIWKALGNHKADIVKMLESQPELATQLRRVRGGYLKIQGTWLAYEVALRLARRVAWPIRHDLVPLFGPTFPTTCLAPDQPGYGTVIPPTGRRKPRRSLQSVGIPPPHSVPYPPRLPMVKEFDYNSGHVALDQSPIGIPLRSNATAGEMTAAHYPHPTTHAAAAAAAGALSTSPIENGPPLPFAPPTVPIVPAVIPANGVPYSPQEPASASQYTDRSSTYSALREMPTKSRYSPYLLPRRRDSPSSSSGAFIIPSPVTYDGAGHPSHPYARSLVHRFSEPNLGSGRVRSAHATLPRLSLNMQRVLPAGEIKRPLPVMPSGPETSESSMEEAHRFRGAADHPGESLGVSSEESGHGSIATPPFNEAALVAYDASYQPITPGVAVESARWPETPGDYQYPQGTQQYFVEAPQSYSDPSTSSPMTTWSYDGYSHFSPAEQHLHYHPHPTRPTHQPYSSMSSIGSFDDRRMSMAESIASAFPEPEMPVPPMSYHRYSQPHVHHPIHPYHADLWMRERSGSFAEPSYGSAMMQSDKLSQSSVEAYRGKDALGHQDFTPSPRSTHTSEHGSASIDGPYMEDISCTSFTAQPLQTEVHPAW